MQDIDFGINWDSPISEELPAGPDTQYSPEFAELETAATGAPEQQYGSVVIPAKEPEWPHVLELATRLSRQTQDLRVLLQTTRALTRLHGLAGLKAGLELLDGLVKRRWEHVHPQSIIDGVEDPHMRFGVLSEFTAQDGLVGDMRQAIAFNSPLGAFTVRDLERIADQGRVEMNGIDITRDQLDQMIRELRQPEAVALELPGQLARLLGEIQQGIEARSGAEFTPDLTPLARPLERISRLLPGTARAQESLAEAGGSESSGLPSDPATVNLQSNLTSRSAVVKAMDAICLYLEHNEPTNPAQLLIRRARRLMDMSFLDIVKELSPDGINQAMFVTGTSTAGGNNS